MDRSVDSIGSCSLDVDADSSDVSDTSGSLNFATPLSAKDITREFTAKIKERCQLSQNTTTYLDPFSGQIHTIVTPPENSATSPGKKPSYLNLACCVNGYSNLTTYDSKVRQDINKSREVSPIRPSTISIQHCKKHNSLAPPIFVSTIKNTQNCKITMTSNQYLNDSIGSNDTVNMADVVDVQYSPQQSFIQQRVERLYGPGALAQVFYSPKKIKSKNSNNLILNERSTNTQSEFCRKYQQLSTSRYFNQCNKPSNNDVNVTNSVTTASNDVTDHSVNNTIDLPVLRHLSQEFRAQLPSISPKRSYTKSHNANSNNVCPNTENNNHDIELHSNEGEGEREHEENKSSTDTSAESLISTLEKCNDRVLDIPKKTEDKDGNDFLEILKQEQNRLLELAHRGEKYICSLTNNEDISEEVFGLLRSASGKARLLVSQKMKQFEGLCHNHMNRSPEDAFPTTIEDLQGFWDMVYLQVVHIDSIFEEIEELKKNDWKLNPTEEKQLTILPPKSSKVSKSTVTKQKPTMNGSTNLQNGNTGPSNSSAAALKREAQRKQFLEMKRKNKIAMSTDKPQTNTASAIEIFVNENNS